MLPKMDFKDGGQPNQLRKARKYQLPLMKALHKGIPIWTKSLEDCWVQGFKY